MPQLTRLDQLEGRTIANAQLMKHQKYEDEAFIRLDFADGDWCVFSAYVGDFSSRSMSEEYLACISIEEDDLSLEPTKKP